MLLLLLMTFKVRRKSKILTFRFDEISDKNNEARCVWWFVFAAFALGGLRLAVCVLQFAVGGLRLTVGGLRFALENLRLPLLFYSWSLAVTLKIHLQ